MIRYALCRGPGGRDRTVTRKEFEMSKGNKRQKKEVKKPKQDKKAPKTAKK
jgi:hypothetical protein